MKRIQLLGIRFLLWSIIIFVFCTMPTPKLESPILFPHIDKVVHFGLFFLFGVFAYSWLVRKTSLGKLWSGIVTLLLVGFYGGLIEWLQGQYFQRSEDIWDWVADVLGGIMGVLLYPILHNIKTKVELRIRNRFFKNRR